MSFMLTFHCGATMVVEDSPILTAEMRREHADIKKSEMRGGCLRVVTWEHSRGNSRAADVTHPRTHDGKAAMCLFCEHRRKAGRKEYEQFPDDYEEEQDRKYANKKFAEFCIRSVACFPRTVAGGSPSEITEIGR
jgi:hypothetical protein